MRIATWNINSIRIRLSRLLDVLERHAPDVLCLQETKVTDEEFPALELKGAGYHARVFGQRSYNGVAILTKHEPENVQCSLNDGVADPQARLIGLDVQGVRVISVYVPNGGRVGTPKWEYKLRWLDRLRRYLETTSDPGKPLALCGDFNIAPDDEDVRNPERWRNTVLCHADGRAALRKVAAWGLVDAFRLQHPEGGIYSWWDYRLLSFPKDDGLRLDGILVTKPLAERVVDAWVDREERKGTKPSDHAPVLVDFSG